MATTAENQFLILKREMKRLLILVFLISSLIVSCIKNSQESKSVGSKEEKGINFIPKESEPGYSEEYECVGEWDENTIGEKIVVPTGIVVDKEGFIWFADFYSVMKLSPSGNLVLKISYDEKMTKDEMWPEALALSPNENLYVSEAEGLSIYSPDGKLLNRIKHFGYSFIAMDSKSHIYSGGAITVIKHSPDGEQVAQFRVPRINLLDRHDLEGIAVDSKNNIYIVDSYPGNDCILKFSPDGKFKKLWRGEFLNPSYLCTDREGNVYVVDSETSSEGQIRGEIHKFMSDGRFITKFGKEWIRNKRGEYADFRDLAVDNKGYIYACYSCDISNRIFGKILIFKKKGVFIPKKEQPSHREERNNLMKVIEIEKTTDAVRQIAMGIVENDISKTELEDTHVERAYLSLQRNTPATLDEDIIRAIQLVEKAGINISEKRIVKEKISLIRALASKNKILNKYAYSLLKVDLKLEGEDEAEILINSLEDKDWRVRKEAGWALAIIGKPAVKPLMKVLKDENEFVRWYSAKALMEIKETQAIEPLIESLSDADVDIQKMATRALAKIGKPAVECLIKALQDENENKRKYSAWALGEIKDVRSVDPLIKAFKDNSIEVRYNIVRALCRIKNPKAIKILIDALKDENIDITLVAGGALPIFNDSRAIDPLIELLYDRRPGVRKRAAEILEKMTWQTFGQNPAKWKEWWEKNKR